MEKSQLLSAAGIQPAQPNSLAGFLRMSSEQRLAWVQASPGIAVPPAGRLAQFVAFSRPRTCIPGMLGFYLASVVAGGVSPLALIVGMVVSYHIAAIANLYNIYTDISEDNENIPTRVYELSRYGRDRLLRHTHLLAAFNFLLSLLVNPWFAGLTFLALVGCQQYSFRPLRMKARARIGILYFANAVAYPYVSAVLASDFKLEALTDRRYCALALYLFVWFCAKGLTKNVPDYQGDKRVKVTTSATLSATRRRAAMIAAVATIVVYGAVVLPVTFGFLAPKYLLALIWLPVACFQAWRLVHTVDQKSSNDMLRDDMFVSVGYLSTLILIERISVVSVTVVVAGVAIMLITDRLRLDTRRTEDFEMP
ncbi:UbiA family prenyltransferase [Mycobacterium vicinigordonae]|uniref:UbiA family prenyltransferase n=1 Tax=Mycobacterium vicinigordonae TaxID=1719132 RepID=A0A7D6I6E4_9MYCO|nr:UbiA family prenyltransferase [Mycobacterium vicinigordonae]QLL08078.1 UbiA family prenyltransferase [Mycobacterium vicinigordonae]